MELEDNMLSKHPTSVAEIKNILEKWRKPHLNKLDKRTFRSLLYGFRIIVEEFEQENDEVDGDIAIKWLKLYLEIQSLIITSESKLFDFSKTVPITITYIIGWLQHGPNDSLKFLNEILSMTIKLVRLTVPDQLKKLEQYEHGVIAALWPIIDLAGSFIQQLQVLELIFLLLKNLNQDFQYYEISNMVHTESDQIKYMLLDLLKQNENNDKFKKLSRKILNLHNESLLSTTSVLSFHCKSIYLGKKLKFTKPMYADRFWFDINFISKTLSFEGRHAMNNARKGFNLNVSLKLGNISVGCNKLIIQFEPPAEISGSLNGKEHNVQEIELAYIEQLTKAETKHLVDILKATDLGKSILKHTSLFDFENRHNNIKEQNKFKNQKSESSQSSRSQLKVQEVKPWNTNFDCLEQDFQLESENTLKPQVYDEYDDIDVSDAEPCQSYKHFKTSRPQLFEELIEPRPTAKQAKKRTAPKAKLQLHNNKQPRKALTKSNFLDFGASTSKAAKETSNRNVMDAFDMLRSETQSSKNGRFSVNEVIDITEDSFEANQIDNFFIEDKSAKFSAEVAELEDALVYQQRSDNEISSDDDNEKLSSLITHNSKSIFNSNSKEKMIFMNQQEKNQITTQELVNAEISYNEFDDDVSFKETNKYMKTKANLISNSKIVSNFTNSEFTTEQNNQSKVLQHNNIDVEKMSDVKSTHNQTYLCINSSPVTYKSNFNTILEAADKFKQVNKETKLSLKQPQQNNELTKKKCADFHSAKCKQHASMLDLMPLSNPQTINKFNKSAHKNVLLKSSLKREHDESQLIFRHRSDTELSSDDDDNIITQVKAQPITIESTPSLILHKNNEETPKCNRPIQSDYKIYSAHADEVENSNSSIEVTQAYKSTPLKHRKQLKQARKNSAQKHLLNNNMRRLFANNNDTDSDVSTNEFTEIIVIAKRSTGSNVPKFNTLQTTLYSILNQQQHLHSSSVTDDVFSLSPNSTNDTAKSVTELMRY